MSTVKFKKRSILRLNLEFLFEYVLLHHSALATAGCDSVRACRSSARVEERLNSYLDPPPPPYYTLAQTGLYLQHCSSLRLWREERPVVCLSGANDQGMCT